MPSGKIPGRNRRPRIGTDQTQTDADSGQRDRRFVYRIARIIKSLHREFRPVKSGAFALNGQHRKDHCRVGACELTSTLQSQIDTAISNRKKEQESTALDSQYLRNRVSFRSSAGPRGGGMAMSKTSRSWCVLYGLVLLQFFVSTASAEIILQTPAGLTEGEKFRFIFLTTTAS
jgi:hypothetical protein